MNVEVNAPMEFQVYTCKSRGVYSSIIPPPKGGGKESKDLRAREENQRKVKKKGRKEKGKEGERVGEREGEGKEKGKRKERKRRVQKERNKRKIKGKEKKYMDKGGNAKVLRNFGISLIIHDRRLSGVYIFL